MNRRTMSIIHAIDKDSKGLTIEELSMRCKVSQRTIRNDINSINELLTEHRLCCLKLKSGGTIKKDKDFCNILDFIDDSDFYTYKLSQGDKEHWNGQAPVLFPICGSIRNDQAKLKNGKTIPMPRHGIVRKKEFTLVSQTKDTIIFGIESTSESYAQYPYEFLLYTQYTLMEKCIEISYIIKNMEHEKMPFQIGGHPGFNCPIFNNEEYEDYEIEFEEEENCSVPTPLTETGLIDMKNRMAFIKNTNKLKLSHALFHKDAVVLDQLKSRKLKLMSLKSHKGIAIDFKDFPYMILWSSANDGPFIAIEPWCGLSTCEDESDLFEEKRNIQIVQAGEMKKYSYTIKII